MAVLPFRVQILPFPGVSGPPRIYLLTQAFALLLPNFLSDRIRALLPFQIIAMGKFISHEIPYMPTLPEDEGEAGLLSAAARYGCSPVCCWYFSKPRHHRKIETTNAVQKCEG